MKDIFTITIVIIMNPIIIITVVECRHINSITDKNEIILNNDTKSYECAKISSHVIRTVIYRHIKTNKKPREGGKKKEERMCERERERNELFTN